MKSSFLTRSMIEKKSKKTCSIDEESFSDDALKGLTFWCFLVKLVLLPQKQGSAGSPYRAFNTFLHQGDTNGGDTLDRLCQWFSSRIVLGVIVFSIVTQWSNGLWHRGSEDTWLTEGQGFESRLMKIFLLSHFLPCFPSGSHLSCVSLNRSPWGYATPLNFQTKNGFQLNRLCSKTRCCNRLIRRLLPSSWHWRWAYG